jgi:hypothetical protein
MILDAPAILAPSIAWSCGKSIHQLVTVHCTILINLQKYVVEDTDHRVALTARPTAPRPKIATVEPFFGFATFSVAPSPKKTFQLLI